MKLQKPEASRSYCFVAFVIILALALMLPSRATGPIPDTALDAAILYKPGHASILVAPPKSLPFFLLVDDSGIGRLVDFIGDPLKLASNGVPKNWAKSKEFLDLTNNKVWTHLTLTQAVEMWGKPRDHFLAGGNSKYFSTFDAYGSFNKEPNIYHLDLRFDPNEKLFSYRVRGIGICNAKWITSSNSVREP